MYTSQVSFLAQRQPDTTCLLLHQLLLEVLAETMFSATSSNQLEGFLFDDAFLKTKKKANKNPHTPPKKPTAQTKSHQFST